ncbi:MAG: hypothetical protein ACJ779_10860 [Chloroflexota bacterium]
MRYLVVFALVVSACGGNEQPSTPRSSAGVFSSASTTGAAHTAATATGTPAGRVLFGSTDPGRDCNHGPSATAFPSGSDIYWWAAFRDPLPGGSAIVLETSLNGDVLDRKTLTIPSRGADCMTEQDPVSGIIRGTYKVRLLFGGKVEAEGSASIR